MLTPQTRHPWWRRHPVLATGAGAVALWWLWLGWYPAVILVTASAVVITVRRRRRAAVIRDAGLRARADYEHQLTMAGDPHGVYGRYPPVTWHAGPYVTQVRSVPPRW